MLNEQNMKRLQEAINEAVDEILLPIQNEVKLRKIIGEGLKQYKKKSLNEADTADTKRKNVMSMLGDDKFNHAELMRHLYHPKDKSEEDTYRSLFSKKATGKPDADGAVRHFTDDEINSLYELLRQR